MFLLQGEAGNSRLKCGNLKMGPLNSFKPNYLLVTMSRSVYSGANKTCFRF
jgi:hypothetical protein